MNSESTTPTSGRPLAVLAALVGVGGLAISGAAFAAASPPAVAPAAAPAATPPKAGLNLNMGMSQVDKMLDKVQATPDQRTKIKAILMDAFMSMASIAPEAKATMGAFGKSLMAPRVSRVDLEAARVSAVADFDAVSKVMVKALGDAADTLTPEQRARLAKPKSSS